MMRRNQKRKMIRISNGEVCNVSDNATKEIEENSSRHVTKYQQERTLVHDCSAHGKICVQNDT